MALSIIFFTICARFAHLLMLMSALAAGSWGPSGDPRRAADYVAVTGPGAGNRDQRAFLLPSLRPEVRSPTSEVVGRATTICFIR
jgi:hypothetical protein